jgi:hypothetical protein
MSDGRATPYRVTDPSEATAVRQIAAWLVESGLPYDWHSDQPPPTVLLKRLVREVSLQSGESIMETAWAIEQETGWKVPSDV